MKLVTRELKNISPPQFKIVSLIALTTPGSLLEPIWG
jgi:hypothetical protein